MPLKQFTIDFQELTQDFFLRSDFDYFKIKKKLNLDKVPKLKKYLKFLETGKPIIPEDYYDYEKKYWDEFEKYGYDRLEIIKN